MSIVRLDFDVDGDVYPELYAALSALSGTPARAERIRHLAAAGLVWENVRIHGAAAIGPTPVAEKEKSGPAVSRPASSTKADPVPASERRRGARRPAEAPAGAPRSADFVDLAIDAMPVLMDVVGETEVRGGERFDSHLPPPTSADTHPKREDGDTARDEEPSPALEEAVLHVASLSDKPATRSRLMRMKERGLFKNG